MTINNVNPIITYEGNGSTVNWVFGFSVPDASVVQVFLTDADGVIRQLNPFEYSVALSPLVGTNPTPPGGTVTLSAGFILPAGEFITIIRDVPPVQNVSLTNQSIIYPPVIEREFDYLTMLAQQGGLGDERAIKVPIGDPLRADLPLQAARRNQTAVFNDNGDFIAGSPLANTIIVSTAMQLVVQAVTTTEAVALLGVYPDPRLITSTYSLVPDDNNRILVLQGNAFYLVSAGDPAGYPVDFRIQLINNDTRAKLANIFGYPSQFVIYPDQQVFINHGPSGWVITRTPRWRPLVPTNLFVDPNLGSDDPTVTDGLASGSGAFKTIAHAVQILETNLDQGGEFTVNLANGFYTAGVILNKRPPPGYKIVGNVANANNVTISVPASTVAFTVMDGALLDISGVTLAGGASSVSLLGIRGGIISIGNIRFGNNPGGSNIQLNSSILNINSSYRIAGGTSAQYHIGAFYNSTVSLGSATAAITVTLEGSVTFASGYYSCQLNSTIVQLATTTYVNPGFATGTPKAVLSYNSIVNAGGATIPGDIAASATNGSYFF